MDLLARLHAARWQRRGSGALSGARLAFHKEFAAVALRRGWLRLWFLEVDNDPVAAWYGFRFGGDEWYYQSGRDLAWDAYSVGFVLLCHTLRETFTDGCGAYRFLRGDEEYKDRFATRATQLETTVRGCGPRGRAAAQAASVASRLPVQLRSRLAGLAG
jgi:CelD/BcsL family acetyltransferase involved in cellulose biosynthesis